MTTKKTAPTTAKAPVIKTPVRKVTAPAQAAAKPAAKPIVKAAAKAVKPTAKPAVKAVENPAAKAAVKPTDKTAVKPTAKQAGKKTKKEHKIKVVRDSFTMPQNEYQKIAEIKAACLKAGLPVKKSEVLRAGLIALSQLDAAQLKRALGNLEKVKTGRPQKN